MSKRTKNKPEEKEARASGTKHASRTSFNPAIQKIYSKLVGEGEKAPRISGAAKKQLNYIAQAVTRRVYHNMNETAHDLDHKTLSETNARKAVLVLADNEYAIEIRNYIDNALRKFSKTAEKRSKNSKSDRVSVADQAGLSVGPPLVNKYLRLTSAASKKAKKDEKDKAKKAQKPKKGGDEKAPRQVVAGYDARVSSKAKIVVAAFIDYLLTNILEQGIQQISEKKSTLTPRNILLGVDSDTNLRNFFRKNKIYILEAGVTPYTPSFLKITDEMKKANQSKKLKAKRERGEGATESGGIKKARTHLPGTVATRDIKKAQNSTELIGQYGPYEHVVHSGFNLIDPEKVFRFNKPTVQHMLDLHEQIIVDFMREALDWSGNLSKRISLDPRVLARVAENHGVKIRQLSEANEGKFKTQTIMRLARKAGSRRTLKKKDETNSLINVVGAIFEFLINEILVPAAADMAAAGKSTFSARFLRQGAFAAGLIVPSFKRQNKTQKKAEEAEEGAKGAKGKGKKSDKGPGKGKAPKKTSKGPAKGKSSSKKD